MSAKKKTEPKIHPDDARRKLRADAAHARALEGYNGWDNYETWCVHMWLNNDPGHQRSAVVLARPGADYEGAERLKDYVGEFLVPELEGFAADLFLAAMSEVNWLEIARAFREEN